MMCKSVMVKGYLDHTLILLLLLVCLSQPLIAIERVPGSRPGTYFYHNNDGFHYTRNSRSGNQVYFKCIQYESGCRGRAIYRRNEGIILTQEHNHHEDMHYPQYAEVRHRILERCRALDPTPFRMMIMQEALNTHPTVLGRLRSRAMRLAMGRARLQAYPRILRSLGQLSNLLQGRGHRHLTATVDGTDNIYLGSVTANDNNHAVLFGSQRMLRFMRRCHTLFSDGTFRCVPAMLNGEQVFVILTTWNYHIIPLVWGFLESRTESLYRAVLSLLRRALGQRLRVRRIITDWEAPQRNAWAAIMPQARLQGCYFHYARAVLRYAREEIGLTWWLRNDRFVRGIMRLICALPLLFGNVNQKRGAILIARTVNRRGNFYRQLLRPLLAYIWRQWVNNRRRQASLCFFGSIHRTNNCCESHNRVLNSLREIFQ